MFNFTTNTIVLDGVVDTGYILPNISIGETLVYSGEQPIVRKARPCQAVIGFKSVLRSSSYVGDNSDAKYPFSSCLDFRDNTQYSPANSSGSVVIEISQLTETDIDYIGIGIHNGKTAELSGTLEVFTGGVWALAASFTPTGDNKTITEHFDTVKSAKQRLTLNFSSKIYIGAIYMGKAWVFDNTPAIGFIPGHTNSLDQLESFSSESNQFIMGRVIKYGYNQKGQLNFVSWNYDSNGFEDEYVEYMNHIKQGKAVFMKWNRSLQQNFFGRASNPNSLQPPSYETNNTGTFYFDYKGFA